MFKNLFLITTKKYVKLNTICKQHCVNFSIFAKKIKINENLVRYSNSNKTEKLIMLETALELPVALLLNLLSNTTGIYVCIDMYIYIYVYIYICNFLHIYICICIKYIYYR
jgi:hypothetical protein